MSDYFDFLSLPQEVAEIIIQHLDKKDLKATRLTSRYLKSLSTSLLFEEVVIFPHLESLCSLQSIANIAALAEHIKTICLDARFIRISSDMMSFAEEVVSSGQLSEYESLIGEDLYDFVSDFHHRTLKASDQKFDRWLPKCFANMLSLLPNFRSFRVREASWLSRRQFYSLPQNLDEQIPEFYAAGLRHILFDYTMIAKSPEYMPASGFFTRSFLLSMFRQGVLNQMHTLRIDDFRWTQLLQYVDPSFHYEFLSALCKVKSFTLHPYLLEPWVTRVVRTEPHGSNMLLLQGFLKILINLNTLKIRFGGPVFTNDEYTSSLRHMIRTGVTIFNIDRVQGEVVPERLTWSPELKHLDLEGLLCTSKELKSILGHCASSVRSLRICHLGLVSEYAFGPRACLVDLFKWMQRNLSLQRIELEGTFTNGGMQDWCFTPAKLDRSLYGRGVAEHPIQDFILHGGLCPLEQVAIKPGYYDVHQLKD